MKSTEETQSNIKNAKFPIKKEITEIKKFEIKERIKSKQLNKPPINTNSIK